MRDVTNIPKALLDVIARAIKAHTASVFGPLDERLKAIETREVFVPTVKDYDAPVQALVTAQAAAAEAINEIRLAHAEALGHAQATIDGLRERLTTIEAREVPVPKDGKDGENGRDAFELDVLPVIDFARDYARGTLAQHKGGLWRAHANTHGAHGWSCVVDGITSTFVAMDSERSFTVHIERSSGAHETASFAMPVMIYRGVFHAGETYRTGDVVTWAGSLWHCNATTDTKPDAGGDAWTLAAKRGRDGKDARMQLVGGTAA